MCDLVSPVATAPSEPPTAMSPRRPPVGSDSAFADVTVGSAPSSAAVVAAEPNALVAGDPQVPPSPPSPSGTRGTPAALDQPVAAQAVAEVATELEPHSLTDALPAAAASLAKSTCALTPIASAPLKTVIDDASEPEGCDAMPVGVAALAELAPTQLATPAPQSEQATPEAGGTSAESAGETAEHTEGNLIAAMSTEDIALSASADLTAAPAFELTLAVTDAGPSNPSALTEAAPAPPIEEGQDSATTTDPAEPALDMATSTAADSAATHSASLPSACMCTASGPTAGTLLNSVGSLEASSAEPTTDTVPLASAGFNVSSLAPVRKAGSSPPPSATVLDPPAQQPDRPLSADSGAVAVSVDDVPVSVRVFATPNSPAATAAAAVATEEGVLVPPSATSVPADELPTESPTPSLPPDSAIAAETPVSPLSAPPPPEAPSQPSQEEGARPLEQDTSPPQALAPPPLHALDDAQESQRAIETPDTAQPPTEDAGSADGFWGVGEASAADAENEARGWREAVGAVTAACDEEEDIGATAASAAAAAAAAAALAMEDDPAGAKDAQPCAASPAAPTDSSASAAAPAARDLDGLGGEEIAADGDLPQSGTPPPGTSATDVLAAAVQQPLPPEATRDTIEPPPEAATPVANAVVSPPLSCAGDAMANRDEAPAADVAVSPSATDTVAGGAAPSDEEEKGVAQQTSSDVAIVADCDTALSDVQDRDATNSPVPTASAGPAMLLVAPLTPPATPRADTLACASPPAAGQPAAALPVLPVRAHGEDDSLELSPRTLSPTAGSATDNVAVGDLATVGAPTSGLEGEAGPQSHAEQPAVSALCNPDPTSSEIAAPARLAAPVSPPRTTTAAAPADPLASPTPPPTGTARVSIAAAAAVADNGAWGVRGQAQPVPSASPFTLPLGLVCTSLERR